MKRNDRLTLIVLTALVVLLGLLYLVRAIAVPFLLALLLAYFLDPAVDLLEERKLPRPLAVVVVFGAFLLCFCAALLFLVPSLNNEFSGLRQSLPDYALGIYRMLPDGLLQSFGIQGDQDLQGWLNQLLQGAENLSFDVVNQVLVFLSRAFSSTLSFIVAVFGYFIIPVYLFYLLNDFDKMKDRVVEYLPHGLRERVVALSLEINSVLGAFIRGQLTVCLILAALYSIGLYFIGIDLSLAIGMLAGAAFIVPYLGTILGILLAGSMAVLQFQDWLHPLLVLGWFGVVQSLEGLLITPRVVGDRVGLHPVETILAVLIGGDLFGFFGILLAVPVVASAKVLLRHGLERYRSSSFFLGPEA